MNLRQRISEAPKGKHNRYPRWVREECRRLYREGHSVEDVAVLSGVSVSTVNSWRTSSSWRWQDDEPWDDPIYPLHQEKSSRLVMPTDAASCLAVAAELLWLARGGRP